MFTFPFGPAAGSDWGALLDHPACSVNHDSGPSGVHAPAPVAGVGWPHFASVLQLFKVLPHCNLSGRFLPLPPPHQHQTTIQKQCRASPSSFNTVPGSSEQAPTLYILPSHTKVSKMSIPSTPKAAAVGISALTARETEILSKAWGCLKSGPPEVS